MGLFRRKEPSYLIPVGPDNATNKDWVILLETSVNGSFRFDALAN
jgi:hypothetical protein